MEILATASMKWILDVKKNVTQLYTIVIGLRIKVGIKNHRIWDR